MKMRTTLTVKQLAKLNTDWLRDSKGMSFIEYKKAFFKERFKKDIEKAKSNSQSVGRKTRDKIKALEKKLRKQNSSEKKFVPA